MGCIEMDIQSTLVKFVSNTRPISKMYDKASLVRSIVTNATTYQQLLHNGFGEYYTLSIRFVDLLIEILYNRGETLAERIIKLNDFSDGCMCFACLFACFLTVCLFQQVSKNLCWNVAAIHTPQMTKTTGR
jgi:hypothetical protein